MASESDKDLDAQVPPTLATGPDSATGAALSSAEIPKGEDRGSKVEIEGGDGIKPDWEAPKPVGAQAEPARFTSNGQLPHNTVPSPTGSVPLGATSLSVEDARAKAEEIKQDHDDYVAGRFGLAAKRIPNETIARLHPAELRAIAQTRGYQLDDTAGTRASRQQFREAQDADESLKEKDARVEKARKGSKKASKEG